MTHKNTDKNMDGISDIGDYANSILVVIKTLKILDFYCATTLHTMASFSNCCTEMANHSKALGLSSVLTMHSIFFGSRGKLMCILLLTY